MTNKTITINGVEYETKPQTLINLARAEMYYNRLGLLSVELMNREKPIPIDKMESKLTEWGEVLDLFLKSVLVSPPVELPFRPEHIEEIYSFFSQSPKASTDGAGTSPDSTKAP